MHLASSNQNLGSVEVTKFGIFAIFSILLSFSPTLLAETMCDLTVQDIKSAAISSTISELPNELKAAPVILIGEVHYLTPLEAVGSLVDGFSKSHQNDVCLALELRPDFPTVDEHLGDMTSRLENLRKIPNPDLTAQKFTSVFSDVTSYYVPINNLAKTLQMKVFAADNPNFNASIDERNKYIADFIEKLLSSGQCSAVLGMFGKAHLSKGMMRATNIRDLIRQNNVQAISVNMQMTNEQNTIQEARSFDLDCNPQKTISNFTWVQNAKLRLDPKLFPHIDGEGSTYSQFDYSILVPSNLPPRSQTTYVEKK